MGGRNDKESHWGGKIRGDEEDVIRATWEKKQELMFDRMHNSSPCTNTGRAFSHIDLSTPTSLTGEDI